MKKLAALILMAGWGPCCATTERAAGPPGPRPGRGIGRMRSDHFQRFTGADFCKNVTLGFTPCLTLLAGAEAGTPDPGWDFEPDLVTIHKGDIVSAVNQGGEVHTFTEVKAFGNGFIPPLNPGSATSAVPDCTGGFGSVAVAKTRMLQGSHLDITGLSKGKHLFQCCIHPWMRMEVDVK